VFEQASIDYCCGGEKTLEEVCQKKGIDSSVLLATLEEALPSGEKDDTVDTAALSLSELADHIEQTHHSYLRSEFPCLDEITKKVASVHGEKDSRLY
jgi:regulator of cell morphogenesis and NO signaling